MTATTRMLLSHNCILPDDWGVALDRAAFAEVFIKGLIAQDDVQCRLIENPHWVVEVLFDGQQQTPADIAALCAASLGQYRQKNNIASSFTVMMLGGMKTTPVMGTSPTSLQTGEWGVDVVETVTPDQFLAGLNWDGVTAEKPPEQIFKVTHAVTA